MLWWIGALLVTVSTNPWPVDTGDYYLVREIVVWGKVSLGSRLPLSYARVSAETPQDLIGKPGVALRDYLGLTGLSLRGSSMEQLQTLVEGFPVKPAQTGYLDLGLWVPGMVRALDLVPNPLSAYAGADAMAGVVNLHLDFRPGGWLRWGSLGDLSSTWHHVLTLSPGHVLQLGGGWQRTAQAFTARDEFQRPLRVDNLGQHRWSAALRWLWRGGEVLALGALRQGGIPRIPNLSLRRDSLTLALALLGVRWQRWQLTWNHHLTRYRPEGGPQALHREWNGDLRYRWHLWELRGSFTHLVSTQVGSHQRWTLQIALRDTLDWTWGFGLVGVRGYWSSTVHRPVWTATLGVHFPGGVYAVWSQGFREPTFNELYWPRDAFAQGNPSVRPEFSWEAEVGGRVQHAAGNLRMAVFHREVRDLIHWVPVQQRYQPINTHRAVLEGAEVSATAHWGSHRWQASLSGFWTLRSPQHLVYVPWAQASLSWFWRGWGVEYRWIGPRWERPSGPKVLQPVHLVRLQAEGRWGTWGLRVQVENLLDVSYEWVRGFPQPGRTLTLELFRTWAPGTLRCPCPGHRNSISQNEFPIPDSEGLGFKPDSQEHQQGGT